MRDAGLVVGVVGSRGKIFGVGVGPGGWIGYLDVDMGVHDDKGKEYIVEEMTARDMGESSEKLRYSEGQYMSQ